jgi:hypothetical protein
MSCSFFVSTLRDKSGLEYHETMPEVPKASLLLTSRREEQTVVLVSSVDAVGLCSGGGGKRAPSLEAIALVDRFAYRRMADLRDFVARAKLRGCALSQTDDTSLLGVVRAALRAGELVAVRKADGAEQGDPAGDLRQLVQQIERATRGALRNHGRQYKLVVAQELATTPERDSYQVVPQAEASKVLASIADQAAGQRVLVPLLAEASENLSRDWRPPLSPTGLVLLRRTLRPIAMASATEAAITPSALRKLKDEGWIEIAVVDGGGEPVADVAFDLRLADGQSQSGKTSKKGSARLEGITPGECTVSFPTLDGPVVQV